MKDPATWLWASVFLGFAVDAGRRFWLEDDRSQLLRLAYCVLLAGVVVVRRPPRDVDSRWWTKIVAVAHVVFLAIPLPSSGSTLLPMRVLVVAGVVGLLLSGLGLIDLGRSFGVAPANRGVVTSGLYQYVRHPVYLGYIIVALTALLAEFSAARGAATALFFLLTALRISVEEAHLVKDATYVAYSQRVRWRVIPGVY